VAILKMETDRNLMSGINSGHHNLPTYEISLKLNNVEFVQYCGGHFKNGDRKFFSISGINLGHHNLPTYEMSLKLDNVEFCGIVVAILKVVTGRNFSRLGINSGHHYLLTYHILMISDNVEFLPPILYPHFCSHFENGRNLEMQNCSSNGDLSLCQILCLYHYPFRSSHNVDFLPYCGVVAILKIATGRNFSMSGINLGHNYLPTYQILIILDNVEFLPPIFMP
jgi:hypothetical protein